VVRANIEAIGLAEAFTFIISGEDVEHGKPAPDPYKAAAATANLDAGQCLVVEDSAVGIRSALEAGCIVCAWPESPDTIPAEARDADYVLETEADFPYDIVS
jgi:beta-phosphoglucomutase-like phosphatase (HAD superfamily)